MLGLKHFDGHLVYISMMKSQGAIFLQKIFKRGGVILVSKSKGPFMYVINLFIHGAGAKHQN